MKKQEKQEKQEKREIDPSDPSTWPKLDFPETATRKFYIQAMGTYLLKSIIKEPVYDHSIHFLYLRNSEHTQH